MKKVSIFFAIITAMIIAVGCGGESDKSCSVKGASLIVDSTNASTTAGSLNSIAANTTGFPSVVGVVSSEIFAAAYMYEPESTLHESNRFAPDFPRPNMGDTWSEYLFIWQANDYLVKNGEISDIESWGEKFGSINYKTFSNEYVQSHPSFRMDAIVLTFSNISILTEESGTGTPIDFFLYGNALVGRELSGAVTNSYTDILHLYPEYALQSMNDILTNRKQKSVVISGLDISNGFSIMYVNPSIFPEITKPMLISMVCDGSNCTISGLDASSTSYARIKHLGTNGMCQARLGKVILVIPYTAQSISNTGGVVNGAYTNPVISVKLNMNDIFAADNTFSGKGTLMCPTKRDIWYLGNSVSSDALGSGYININGDMQNGALPFNVQFNIEEDTPAQ